MGGRGGLSGVSEGSAISRPLVNAINARPNAKAIKVPGHAYMEVGTPDNLAVVDAVAYWLEAKQPGEQPDVIQTKRLKEWHDAGAVVGIVYSKTEGLAIIDGDAATRAECLARCRFDRLTKQPK